MEREEIRRLVDGAAYLFTNEYEAGLTEQKTGWSGEQILERVAVRVTTHGAKGSVIERRGEPAIQVACAQEDRKADPTGVGDAFRGGFLAGLAWELPLERCAEIGSLIAAHVIETVGTQEYDLGQARFLERLGDAYGPAAVADVAPHVRCLRP
jgi:adenosine kinase